MSPLQNRVSPFGSILAHPARGMLTGNRGVLHDPVTKTLHPTKRWTSNAWIICLCEAGRAKRDVFGSNAPSGGGPGWTNLFFLDEATALAAGHRPCFSCQRSRAREFQAAMSKGLKATSSPLLLAPQMDEILHRERLDGTKKALHSNVDILCLPDYSMVANDEGVAYLFRKAQFYKWSFWGYDEVDETRSFNTDDLVLLTPPSTVAALNSGYVPSVHPSIHPKR